MYKHSDAIPGIVDDQAINASITPGIAETSTGGACRCVRLSSTTTGGNYRVGSDLPSAALAAAACMEYHYRYC